MTIGLIETYSRVGGAAEECTVGRPLQHGTLLNPRLSTASVPLVQKPKMQQVSSKTKRVCSPSLSEGG